jgi:hypothetical protein
MLSSRLESRVDEMQKRVCLRERQCRCSNSNVSSHAPSVAALLCVREHQCMHACVRACTDAGAQSHASSIDAVVRVRCARVLLTLISVSHFCASGTVDALRTHSRDSHLPASVSVL